MDILKTLALLFILFLFSFKPSISQDFCDSSSIEILLCPGETYMTPSGEIVSLAGVYIDTIQGFNCDSVVHILITEGNLSTGAPLNPSICQGSSYVLPSGQIVTQAGTYIDTIQIQNQCPQLVTVNLSVEECTGLSNSINLIEDILVYPNPSNSKYSIDLKSIHREIEVDILNYCGVTILETNFKNQKYLELDLTDYLSGIYFIQLKLDGKETLIKVVKD